MFFPSRKIAALLFLSIVALSLGVFGAVSSGASEPSPLTGVTVPVTTAEALPGAGEQSPQTGAAPASSFGSGVDRLVLGPPKPQKFAVIIGILYDSNELGVVNYADRDAASLYSLLTEKMGFPPENIILLQNQQATRENITMALNWLVTSTSINPRSDIVFYYSGHGLTNGLAGIPENPGFEPSYALVPFDYKNFDYKAGAGLFWDGEIASYLSRINPGRMWITIDSCFSGGFDRPGISGPNRVLTLSSQANELSGEISQTGRGVFTQFMVDEGLARGLSVEQAFLEAVPRAAQPYGQHPHISDNYPGNLDFFQPAA